MIQVKRSEAATNKLKSKIATDLRRKQFKQTMERVRRLIKTFTPIDKRGDR